MSDPVLGEMPIRQWMADNNLQKSVQVDFPPMYGASRHRNEFSSSGGASLSENDGSLHIDLGANGSDRFVLGTNVDGQYRSGTFAEGAFGIRIPGGLQGDQEVRWGLDAPRNGVGWGLDATSFFTYWKQGDSITRYRPEDKPDPDWLLSSASNITAASGQVFKILARMYGHGPVLWALEQKYPGLHRAPSVPVDKRVYDEKINVRDFNKPLRVIAENNGTAAEMDVFVDGRQYTIWGQPGNFERRITTDLIRSFTTAGSGTWEPLIAIRKKPEFPAGTSRRNSVRVAARSIRASADGDCELRYTQEADVTNPGSDYLSQGSMKDPSETAVETIIDQGGTNGNEYTDATADLQVDTDKGGQFGHLFASGSPSRSGKAKKSWRSRSACRRPACCGCGATAPSPSTPPLTTSSNTNQPHIERWKTLATPSRSSGRRSSR